MLRMTQNHARSVKAAIIIFLLFFLGHLLHSTYDPYKHIAYSSFNLTQMHTHHVNSGINHWCVSFTGTDVFSGVVPALLC